jgi:hypothetical protein
MPHLSTSPFRASRLRAVTAGLLVLCAACGEDSAGPSSTSALPSDPTGTTADPIDVGVAAVLDTRSSRPGIVFGSAAMRNNYLNSVHTGWNTGGPLDPSNILSHLSGARAKGGRVVIKLCKGSDSYVKNSDGTFSLTKWKSLVSRYRNVNLGPYISDGTIIGHYLIDEPHRTARWGGKIIPQATLEAMAKYSKEIWPQMTTMVRVVPSWLASGRVTYRYLDAGWLQYAAGKGDAAKLVAAEVAAAKGKGLGLVVGMNVLDGGNGSSGIRGTRSGKWAMSATELRKYGTAILGQSYACAYFNWQHNTDYYGRSAIKSAMADLSAKARSHAKSSCRQ